MEAGRCIKILDPYEWMPGYGENSVEISMSHSDLMIVVSYDGNENGEERQKMVKFTGVSAFYRSSFPGPSMLDISYSIEDKENISISKLVEFPESEAAQAWTDYWSKNCGLTDRIKHYLWIFTAENIRLEIFAKSVQLETHSS